ncbi:CHAT domain-containing protein [Archangium lipolyticum]|uniref:CHAT domain-containing protein n=1 Tax=Archangium lipolyticum TaxID=2970465 RepID=UPI002149BF53|nr:CHAT domain-containing protein [Archangium lipolyticum]
MSNACERLERFVDGELEPAEADAFREHLLSCEPCQAALSEAVQLELRAERLLADEEPRTQVLRLSQALPARRWGRARLVAMGTGLAALAACVLALVYTSIAPPRVPAEVWLAEAPTRSIEARVSDGRADGHRTYDVPRSGPGGAAENGSPSLEALATLERQRDFRGIAAAWLVRGEWKQAAEYLARAPAGPEVDNDLAVIALGQDRPDEALALLERSLRARPRHAQALWNQALAYRQLGLLLKAAGSFEQVVALGEPGWSGEASRAAAALREEVRRRKASWEALIQAGRAMVEHGTPLSPAQVSELPGLARLYLYDAVRASPSRERVLGLLPVARQLDDIDSGTHLQAYVQRTAGRDFTVRRPLAETYASLALGTLPPAELPGFLERLRRSPEQDLLLGALLFSPAPGTSLDEYRRLALATEDPWFALLADDKQAEAELSRGEALAAEARLLGALRRCGDTARLDYRCGRVQRLLSTVYDTLHRPQEAHQHALGALRRGLRSHDWPLELLLFEDLGQLSAHTDKLLLTHAYLEEFLARMEPAACDYQDFVHTLLAATHQSALDFDGARNEVDIAARCGRTPTLARAAVVADLARQRPRPEDEDTLRKALEAVRTASPSNPGESALATSVEGRFELERNRPLGQSLLRRAIAETERLPATDVNGRKARAYSYTSLLFDAGRHGEYDQALVLFSAELEMTPPGRCVLGVTVEDERTLVVIRDTAGKTHGAYDASRKQPFAGAGGLVPDGMVEALRACESVDVLARPPVQGRSGLLPSDVAWAYRVGPTTTRPSALPTRRLVVTDIELPEELRQVLPRIEAPFEPESPGDTTVLRGYAATPSRVLEAMANATEIAIHAHGMIDLGVSDASFLVLSKEDGGRFTLTARDLQETHLEGRPLVLLAACYSGRTTPSLHESFGLPIAFIHAGARWVLATTEKIPNSEAARFFEPVLARIRAGEPPARVLRDERLAWRKRQGNPWVEQVLLFQ